MFFLIPLIFLRQVGKVPLGLEITMKQETIGFIMQSLDGFTPQQNNRPRFGFGHPRKSGCGLAQEYIPTCFVIEMGHGSITL